MSQLLFDAAPHPSLPIIGRDAVFPVHRIFCVGRNYAAHAAEMGNEVDREAPFYFLKSAHHLAQSDTPMPYPPGTQDLHHEVEFVAVLRQGGFQVPQDRALELVFGYAVGLDMTRRDLQGAAKDKRRPWDTGKDFEQAAVIGPITPTDETGDMDAAGISLTVNGEARQAGRLADMVWSLPELIAHLSTLYHLRAGDVIMTGTPSGVGPVVSGDVLHGQIDGLQPVDLTITPAV